MNTHHPGHPPMTADDVRACPFCGHAGPFDQWPCEWLDGSGANVIRCPMCHGAAPMKSWNHRHLTQPAQAVDVGALQSLVAAWRERENRDSRGSGEYYSGRSQTYEICADELGDLIAAALPKDSNGAEGVDSMLLDWLEDQAIRSPTGISLDYCRYVEDGLVLEQGYRFMRRHFLGDRKATLREAIKSAMAVAR